MTHKERFLAALSGRQPDRVPVFDFLDSRKLFQYTNGRLPTDYSAQDIMECTIYLGLDAAFIPFGGFAGYSLGDVDNSQVKVLKDNQYYDEWGTIYQHNESSWPADAPVVHPIATREDLQRFLIPDPYADSRLDGIKKAIELNKDYNCAILGGLNGPFTVALMAMGLENMSYALADDPELIADVMRKANAFLLPAAKRLIDAGVDGVFIAEDLGYNSGLFFNPDSMRKYVLPQIKDLVSHIKKLNSYALFHSCGNINGILDDLIELGIDAINPLQRSASMDLGTIKRKYGNRICLIGNVDSSYLLPNGTVGEITSATHRCIEQGAAGGRFVIASDSDVRDDMPIENILAFFDAAKKFGNY